MRLSPKILLVAPGKRLSWQFHHRRSELWRVVAEIWQHVDPEHPSTEHDIVRLEDDFGR